MPKVVAPWTWRRCLRDFGPDDPTFFYVMLVLATYMDSSGFAYPGQGTWAKAARKSSRTIQRYIAIARRNGWISVVNAGRGGQGWAFNAYRCCVPDWIDISDLDERIGEHLAASEGDIERSDTAMSSPSNNGHDTSMSAPLKPGDFGGQGDDISESKVTTFRAEGDDKTAKKVTTQLCRTNSRSENSRSRTHAQEEAPAEAGVRVLSRKIPKTPATETEIEERRRQAAELVDGGMEKLRQIQAGRK